MKRYIFGILTGLVVALIAFILFEKHTRHIKYTVKYKLTPMVNALPFFSDQKKKKLAISPQEQLHHHPAHEAQNAFGASKGNKPVIRMHVVNFDPAFKPNEVELAVLREIIDEKYQIIFDENNYDIMVTGHLDNQKINYEDNIIRIYYSAEVYGNNPKMFLDNHDLVMGFDFIDHPNYVRVPFSYVRYGNKIRHDFPRNKKCDPKSKPYFACFLVSNNGEWLPGKFAGAKDRDRLFHKLSLYKRVMSGGKHLNNIAGLVPFEMTNKFLGDCKFTIAYENTLDYPGYVTEKPFQPWFAGSVPIYNTHKEGMVDLNPNSVLYAGDFEDEDAFVEYIKKVDNDDDLYCKIHDQQIISDPSKDYEVLKSQIRDKLELILERKFRK